MYTIIIGGLPLTTSVIGIGNRWTGTEKSDIGHRDKNPNRYSSNTDSFINTNKEAMAVVILCVPYCLLQDPVVVLPTLSQCLCEPVQFL